MIHGVSGPPDLEPAADRVASLPVPRGHRLVDERDGRALERVGRREEAAADEALAERFERAVGRDLPVALAALADRRRVAVDRDAAIADRRADRKRANDARGRHAGNRANAIEQRREERVDLLRRAVRTRGQRDARGHHVGRGEAEVDLLERPQRAQHQARARQQQQRERELDDDERAAESQPVAARRHLRAAVAETADEADPERAKRRRQTAEQRGHGARRDEKQRDVPVHRDGRRARNGRRADRVEHALGAKGERQSRDAAGDRQERAFDELLAHQPPAIRAERRARGELALSGFRARQQNRAGVGARDEHQEADGPQQDVERPPDAAEDLVVDRHGERREVSLRRVLTFGRERRRDRRQVVGRLRGRSRPA